MYSFVTSLIFKLQFELKFPNDYLFKYGLKHARKLHLLNKQIITHDDHKVSAKHSNKYNLYVCMIVNNRSYD